MTDLQNHWRDSAVRVHRIIKEKDILVSRKYPEEIFGAFLSYFTREELLDSEHGSELLYLLQENRDDKPYIILDTELGVRRIAHLLRMPTKEAEELAPIFMQMFEKLAPGRVFRSEKQFVETVIMPRIETAMRTSPRIISAFSELDSNHIGFDSGSWEESDELYADLPRGVPVDPEDIEELRKLRSHISETWSFHYFANVYPADEAGKALNADFASWCNVRVDFDRLDRAILASGEHSVNVYGEIAANLGNGHYGNKSKIRACMSIVF